MADPLIFLFHRNFGPEERLVLSKVVDPNLERALDRRLPSRANVRTFVLVRRTEILIENRDVEAGHSA